MVFDLVVARIGRVDVSAGVTALFIKKAVYFQDGRLRGTVEQVLSVIEDQEMARARKTGFDPLHVVRSANLLVAGVGRIPVILDPRRIALLVASRVAEAVKEIASGTRSQFDALLRVVRDKRAIVVDDVEFALNGIRNDVSQFGIVIHRVAVEPIAFQRVAGHVDVDPAREVGNGLAGPRVVRPIGIIVLHDVVQEPPFPNDFAVRVDFDDGVHLGTVVMPATWVGTCGNGLLVRDRLVRNVNRRVSSQLFVEDTNPIVMRRVAGTLFVIFPDNVSVPIQFAEATEAAGM